MRAQTDLQLWGGLECTVNRVGDGFYDQFAKGGHLERPEDLDLVAELGLRTLRYPVLWERTAPEHPEARDWSFADERLGRLRNLDVAPIVGLVHHGGGPRYTSLLDDGFAPGLADHARAVAERYPWVEAYTPVNEPLTTARFSALYGHWYPHARDERSLSRALLNQVRATILSMRAIRRVNPAARLVQTDDLGKTHATRPLRYQADFENERRWLGWDLLCGRVDREHRMWPHLLGSGVDERELGWFLDHACPPDVVGLNHYLTSERFLDHRVGRYPGHTHGGNGGARYADVEAVRVRVEGVDGLASLLRETWARYGLPIAVTECHLGCTREEQVRWLGHVWREAQSAREAGVDVRAVTAWSLFGAHDWCSLLTRDERRYEPGAFDVRAPRPRPTALAHAVRALARGEEPVVLGEGWWERPIRLLYPPVVGNGGASPPAPNRAVPSRATLVVVGDHQGLAALFAASCAHRGIDCVRIREERLDRRSPVLAERRPWAVVDLGSDSGVALAEVCVELGARLLVRSDEGVFDGVKPEPYVESDPPRPGEATDREAAALRIPGGLVVRLGRLFGTPESDGFLVQALSEIRRGRSIAVAEDAVESPTFAPHFVEAALDLLADGEEGVLHLTNGTVLGRAAFVRRVAEFARLDPDLVSGVTEESTRPCSAPRWRAGLRSERLWVMPSLDEAILHSLAGLEESGARHTATYLA